MSTAAFNNLHADSNDRTTDLTLRGTQGFREYKVTEGCLVGRVLPRPVRRRQGEEDTGKAMWGRNLKMQASDATSIKRRETSGPRSSAPRRGLPKSAAARRAPSAHAPSPLGPPAPRTAKPGLSAPPAHRLPWVPEKGLVSSSSPDKDDSDSLSEPVVKNRDMATALLRG